MSKEIPERLRQQVADRAYHVCEYCLMHEDDTFWGCEVDHIISRKHGGLSSPENLAFACARCNGRKGSDICTLVGDPRRLVRLYHPRQDRWGDCFALDGISIESLNDFGTATVNLLHLNDETNLKERRILSQLCRYPTLEALARMKE